MKLSVVIVSYHAKNFLALCLQSVIKATETIDAEIIVVDNHSTDGTCKLIQSQFKSVKLIANIENLGFAKANNNGVLEAKGDYVLILNPDTVVAEDTFTNCLAFAENKKNLGALGVKLIDGTGHFLPESKRNFPTPLVTLFKMLGIKCRKHAYYAQQLSENAVGNVSILVGAFMFLKRETYLAVSGFDTDYFMYGEDIDLSYKLSKAGWQNYYLGTSSVIHFKGESTRKNIKYLKYFYKAMFIFYKKHLKLNFIFELFLVVGMVFWFLMKLFQIRLLPTRKINVKLVVYLGSQIDTFNKLRKLFNNQELIQTTSVKNLGNFDVLVIDLNTMTFKNLIKILENYKSKLHKFRIIPPNSKWLIGSDSASDKGIMMSIN